MKQKLAQLLRKVNDELSHTDNFFELRLEIESALKEYDNEAFLDLEVDKSKKTIYRNSALKKEDVFRATFRNELAAGIDLYYYGVQVERWSNQNEGKKRSYFGWRDTILQFADGDRKKNALVIIKHNQQPDEFDVLFNQ